MAAHKLITTVVMIDNQNRYMLINANGSVVMVDGEGSFLGTSGVQEDPIAAIVKRKRWGTITDLDTTPAPIQAFVADNLFTYKRFPKCFCMLSKMRKGGVKIDNFDKREKQMLNELIQHGVVRKSATKYLLV